MSYPPSKPSEQHACREIAHGAKTIWGFVHGHVRCPWSRAYSKTFVRECNFSGFAFFALLVVFFLFLRVIRSSLLFWGSNLPRCNEGAIDVQKVRTWMHFSPPVCAFCCTCSLLFFFLRCVRFSLLCGFVHPIAFTILQKKKRKEKSNVNTKSSTFYGRSSSALIVKFPSLFIAIHLVPGTRDYYLYSHLTMFRRPPQQRNSSF